MFAFASDLAGEGVTTVLDNLRDRAGVGGITIAFSYHAARDVFPHNPARKVIFHPRGGLYFPPDPARYDGLRLQPRVDRSVRERDVVGVACREAGKRGMNVYAWTVFLHADRPEEHQDCVTVNAFGDPFPNDLCPSNEHVRAYCRALVADIGRYGVASILAESLHFHPLEHGYEHERYFVELGAPARYLLGLCFCEHCLARAAEEGVEGEAVRAAVRIEVERAFADRDAVVPGELEREALADLAGGELAAYLDVRADAVTSLTADLADVADSAGTRLIFMDLCGAVKGYWTGRPDGAPAADIAWRYGIDLPALARVCPGVEALAYAADVERVRLDLDAYRGILGDASLAMAVRPALPDCDGPENLAAKVALARELGLERVDFYHYGFVRLESLDWIRAALDA